MPVRSGGLGDRADRNSIGAENALGEAEGAVDRDAWYIDHTREDNDLSGYAFPLSIEVEPPSNVVQLKIRAKHPFTITILRLGWYGGRGARRVMSLAEGEPLPADLGHQPAAAWAGEHSTVDCSNWSVSASYVHAPDVPSGIFVARVVTVGGPNNGQGRLIPFVVRDDSRRSAILLQLPDVTWQAYNLWTDDVAHSSIDPSRRANGAFYCPDDAGGVTTRASYHRPLTGSAARLPNGRPYDSTCGFALFWETVYTTVRWLERIGADVSYTTGQAVAADYVKTQFSPEESRLLPDAPGRSRLFISCGHDEYWSQERRSNVERAQRAGVHTAFFSGNDMFWRVIWESADVIVCAKDSNAPPRPGGDPAGHTGLWADARCGDGPAENATTGSRSAGYGASRELLVSPEQGRHRFWRHTELERRGTRGLNMHAWRSRGVGHEWNHDDDNGWRPPGLVRLSSTPMAGTSLARGDGDPARGRAASVHHMTLFRHAPSGALVFHAGAIDFGRLLDGFRSDGLDPVSEGAAAHAVQQALLNLFADMGLPRPATLPGSFTWTPSGLTRPPPRPVACIDPLAAPAPGELVPVRGTATAGGRSGIAAVEISLEGERWLPATGRERWHVWWAPSRPGLHRLRARAIDDWGTIGNSDEVELVVPGSAARARPQRTLWARAREPRRGPGGDEVEVGATWRPRTDGRVTGVAYWLPRGDLPAGYVTLWQVLEGGTTRLASKTIAAGAVPRVGWVKTRFHVPVDVTAGCSYLSSVRSTSGLAYELRPPSPSPLVDYVEPVRARWVRDDRRLCTPGPSGVSRDRPPWQSDDDRHPLVEPIFTPTAARRHSLWPESGVEPMQARLDLQGSAEVGVIFSSGIAGWVTAVRFLNETTADAWAVSLWDDRGRRLGTAVAESTRTDVAGWHEVLLTSPVPLAPEICYTASYTAPAGIIAFSDDYFSGDIDDPVRTLVLHGHRGVLGRPGDHPTSIWVARACYFVDVVFRTSC